MIDIEERAARAMGLFRDGYNCCQSVALAFSDVLDEHTGMTPEQIAAVTGGFGGGLARLREVCGCVSGLAFVAGALRPSPPVPGGHGSSFATAPEPAQGYPAPVQGCHTPAPAPGPEPASAPVPASSPMEAKKACYALVQELAESFRRENGAVVCRELLGLRSGRKDPPQPSERTGAYYKARPCERLVGSAARILAEKLEEIKIK